MAIPKRLLVLLVVTSAALFAGHAVALGQTDYVKLLGYEFIFSGASYNAAADETTFTYVVRATREAPHGLSHFEIALCLNHHVLARYNNGKYKTSHPDLTEVGTDPNSNVTGIKFDVEVEKGQTETFWFVLQGKWSVADVSMAGKAATKIEHGTLAGPACPGACEIHYSVEANRIDLRVLRPGTYASILGKITLSGTGAAKLAFDEFGPPEYLVSALSPPIDVEYSIGATVEEATSYGWRTPQQFNQIVLSYSEAELEGGVEVTIWVRYTVTPANRSSDYEALGRVLIIPDCP